MGRLRVADEQRERCAVYHGIAPAVQVYVPQLCGDVPAREHLERSLMEEAHVGVRIVDNP